VTPPTAAPAGSRELTYAAAISEALGEALEADPTVFVMGEDVGRHGGVFRATADLFDRFGAARVRDTPISESALVGAGLGAALTGMRPVVEIQYSDFLTECMDQLVNQLAKVRYMSGGQVSAPLVVRAPGGRAKSAASQHSQSLESWFVSVPGLQVVMPSTPADAKGLLTHALRGQDPVLFIEHKLLYRTKGPVPIGEHDVPFGAAAIRRVGTDVTIVSASWLATETLTAASVLAAEGIEAEVIDLRTLVPLDLDAVLASVARTGRLLVAHEAPLRGGWGGDLVAQVVERGVPLLRRPARVGARFAPVPMAPEMEEYVVPSSSWIVDAARALFADP
jgi:pyruvate/2-oxoglutarate/acetoin dehydrogenase E1 component